MKSSAMYKMSRKTFLGIVMIIFGGLALYSNIMHAPFFFDDYSSVVDNDSIKNINRSFQDTANNRYLTMLSFALNYSVSGLKPYGYHLINNFIHIINALFIYFFIILTFQAPYYKGQQSSVSDNPQSPLNLRGDREGLPSSHFIAFSVAFIFIAHPIQTQAVTYIAQRATSMAAMFYLISLVMYIKWRLITEHQNSSAEAQQMDPKNYWATALLLYCASLVSAFFAMKTKEIAFTLPIIITLYEFCFFRRSSGSVSTLVQTQNWKRILYLFPVILTILIIPLSKLDIHGTVEGIVEGIDVHSKETVRLGRADYLFTQFKVITTYMRLLIFPVGQSIDYDYPISHSFLNPEVYLSFLFLLSIFGMAVYLFSISRIRYPGLRLVAFGILWFFITLSVESSIIPIKDVIAEHRLYLPSIGFFIVFILSLEYFVRQRSIKIGAVVIIVAVLSLATFSRNSLWNHPQALWENVLVKFPDNARAHNGLGVIFKEQGEYDRALIRFEKVLKINPTYFPAYYNIGDIQYKLGNYKSAMVYFIRVLELKPSYNFHLDALNSLAITYSEMGDDRNAVSAFKEAIRLFPPSAMLYNNLGRQYIKMGDFDSAIEILKKGIEVREEPYLRSNLSIAYAAKSAGQTKK